MGNIEASLPELEVSKPKPKKDTEESEESDDYSDSSGDEIRKPKVAKVKVDNSWKEKDLKGLGIKLSFNNKQDALVVSECTIQHWSMEERNKHMEDILSGKNEFIASEIYEVTGPKVTFTQEVTVTVSLGKDISKRHKVKVKMMVSGRWTKEDATFKKGKAVFKTKRVEHFVIVGDLVTKRIKVPPEGTKVKVDEKSKMEVDIPAGAVDDDQDMDFQVQHKYTTVQNYVPFDCDLGAFLTLRIIPPDAAAMEKYLRGETPLCKALVGVTECLYGDSPSTLTFKKPVTVKLPFEDQPEQEDVTPVFFRMSGNEIRMMDKSTEFGLSDDGVCNLQVSAFSGYFAGYVRNESLSDVRTIESETRLLFGKNYIATVLIFRERDKMATGFPKIWIEIVDKVNVERTVEKRTNQGGMVELPNSRSPDIKVFDGYRLRMDIVGNLKGLRDIPKSYYLITYLDVAEDNHKLFTVEKRGDGLQSIGIINFYSDKGSKECVHSVQIDTVVGFDKVYRSDHVSEARPRTSVSGDDGSSMATHYSGHASGTTIANDAASGMSGPAQHSPLERKDSTMSIGSATSLLSQNPLCQALTEASLYNMAEMIKGADDGLKLSAQLKMSDDFENISQNSQTPRAAVFKLLKEWVKLQTDKREAVDRLNNALKDAKLKKVADIFMKAVKKDKQV